MPPRLPIGEPSDDPQPPRERIEQAIEQLTEAELRQLRAFAQYRSYKGAFGFYANDLLAEAIERTRDGRRHWRASVQLMDHLFAVIRSISSDWRDRARREVAYSDDTAQGRQPSPERYAIAREALEQLFECFQDDDHALAVIRGRIKKWTARQTMLRAGMSAPEYASALRRVQAHALRFKG